MRQTVAFMAPPSTRSWTRYPWRISADRHQSVLSLSAYATKIGRSLVPARYPDATRSFFVTGQLARDLQDSPWQSRLQPIDLGLAASGVSDRVKTSLSEIQVFRVAVFD